MPWKAPQEPVQLLPRAHAAEVVEEVDPQVFLQVGLYLFPVLLDEEDEG